MDSRIGELMRLGGIVHYAFRGSEYREGEPSRLLDWLDGNEEEGKADEVAAPASMKGRDYVVSVEAKHPAWNDAPFEKTVFAADARAAERQVRDWMFREGLHSRLDGALIVKARRAD